MSWIELMTYSFIGLAAALTGVVLTVYQGLRYHRYAPKEEVHQSLTELKRQYKEKQEELDELRDELFAAQRIIDEAEARRQWMDETRQELVQLEARKQELQTVETQLAGLREERAELDARVQELIAQKRDVESELGRQRVELLSPEDYEKRRREHAQLDELVRTLAAQHGPLEQKVRSLETKQEQLEDQIRSAKRDYDDLLASIDRKRQDISALEESIERLKADRAQFGGVGLDRSVEESTKLLWQPVLRSGEYVSAFRDELAEESALEAGLERIKASGLVYDDRVVKAFHTALKCSDESPLLVLAGISGTGKSALPARYAEAMGMHFLNVAVQPGWDSPADLLGFYNHLEGRFRPTELTRALLQMDFIHESAAEGRGPLEFDAWPVTAGDRSDLGERMLLVLLDEMNLARVEYYFSEFLSRLELRRGIDPAEDEEARRRSELVLDLGSVGEGQGQSLRIYVGGNVLFVGTMNEDESTQALSDKVIDRSNVMRFGRPADLMVGRLGALQRVKTKDYLLHATWKSWIAKSRVLSDIENHRVSGWIERANGALGPVGRPFAYRVSGAIRRYVEQYPGRGDQSLQDAFADQVELRVLPRLRGLDLQEPTVAQAVNEVTRLVDELGDEVLSAALRRACDAGTDQLFQWNGVDRRLSEASIR